MATLKFIVFDVYLPTVAYNTTECVPKLSPNSFNENSLYPFTEGISYFIPFTVKCKVISPSTPVSIV